MSDSDSEHKCNCENEINIICIWRERTEKAWMGVPGWESLVGSPSSPSFSVLFIPFIIWHAFSPERQGNGQTTGADGDGQVWYTHIYLYQIGGGRGNDAAEVKINYVRMSLTHTHEWYDLCMSWYIKNLKSWCSNSWRHQHQLGDDCTIFASVKWIAIISFL